MRTDPGGGVSETTVLSQRLSELKQNGSSVLVVGQVDEDVHGAACRHLLGAEDATRRRLFVLTRGTDACACSPDSLDEPHCRIVRQASSDEPQDCSDRVESVVENGTIGELGSEIVAQFDELEADADGIDPAEARLCFDSVDSLVEQYDSEQVFQLLHVVTSRVRQADGMGHFHAQMPRESDHVNLLEPLFDIVVEMKSGEEATQQRWHLDGGDVSTDWIQL